MMRLRVFVLLAVALPLMAATVLQAQTTSELAGRVIYEDQGMPGVTVSVESSALQGQRTTTTNRHETNGSSAPRALHQPPDLLYPSISIPQV